MPDEAYRDIPSNNTAFDLQNIFDNAPIGIFVSTPDGRLLFANPALARMHGYESSEEFLGAATDIAARLYGSPADRVEFQRLMDTHGQAVDHECLFRRKDGTVFWGTLNARAVCDPSGRFRHYQGFMIDSTDRKRTKAALSRSEARFKSIIAVSNTGAWEYQLDKDYLWCSAEYFTMLGHEPDGFTMDGSANLAECWIDLIHPEDRDRATGHFAKYLAGGSVGMYENYFRMKHRDGHWVWIWSRGQTLRNNEGKVTSRTVGTHIDITERKRAEEALEDHGYTALSATSGEEALAAYADKGNSVDLVILDLGMPGMGGRQCLRELLRLDPQARVLVASGYAGGSLADEVRQEGAAGFIGKPFHLAELLARVREALREEDGGRRCRHRGE